jgi:CheY-like chemotaxis protein/HPt (histidine-containing phosphotransfer) domain-containing protein
MARDPGDAVTPEPSPGAPAPVEDDGARTPGQVLALRGRSILVAEDQPVNWLLAERMLSKRGHRVDHAVNGEIALEMLETGGYDLVFMDCQMPVLDGYAATRRVRERERAGGRRHLPIIAMTAHAMAGDREKCLAAGMDDYVAKPISRARVDAMLARWLAEREPRPETLDAARVAELRTLFPDGDFVEMVAELRDDVTAQLELIATAIPAGDATATADAAHRVLNTARMIGATRLIAAAAALETVAEHRDRALREHAALAAAWWEASVALEHELVA